MERGPLRRPGGRRVSAGRRREPAGRGARPLPDHRRPRGAHRGLRERAEAETEQPLLRIYWFDGAPDRVPQPEHRRLRVMPRVTVRLGALTRSDGRWAQKGVDAAMHAELTELARNRACSDIVLVTGDGDLLPGLMSAKEHGVAVHLWAVQAADGDYNQSEDLVAEADERRVLDRELDHRGRPGQGTRRRLRAAARAPPRDRRDPLRAAARVGRSAGRAPAPRRRDARPRPPTAPLAGTATGAGRGRAAPGAARPGRAHPQGPRGARPRPGTARSRRRRPADAAGATLRWSSDKRLGRARHAGRRAAETGAPADAGPAHHAPSSAGPTARRTSPRSAATPSRSARSSPAAGSPGSPTPGHAAARSPPSTRASRTASTASCSATPPASACSPTRTTRSTSTTGTRSGRASGARSTPAARRRRTAAGTRHRE